MHSYDDVTCCVDVWGVMGGISPGRVLAVRGREGGGCKIYDFSAWSDWQDRLEFRSDQPPPAWCVAAQPQFIGTSFGQWSLLVDAKKIGESSNKALLFTLISFLEPEYLMEHSFALLLTVESVCAGGSGHQAPGMPLTVGSDAGSEYLGPDPRASHHDTLVMTSDQSVIMTWWHDDMMTALSAGLHLALTDCPPWWLVSIIVNNHLEPH